MRFLIIIFIFFLFGCTNKPSYIYIPEPNVKKIKNLSHHYIILVKEVSLPYYLQDGKIAYIKGEKILFSNSYFSSDATEFATKRVIELLKSALSTQQIYDFPWSKVSGDILEIDIQKFISDEKKVYLVASWRLFDSSMKLKKSGKYNNSIMIEDKNIVNLMKNLFDGFIQDIAKRI